MDIYFIIKGIANIKIYYDIFKATFPSINLLDILIYTIVGFLVTISSGIFFTIFFNSGVINNFFSRDRKEYGRPLVFYLIPLFFITSGASPMSSLIESFYITLLIKFIGYLERNIGETVLKIAGAYAFVRVLLSPIQQVEVIEISLMISVMLVAIVLIMCMSSDKLKILFSRGTSWIIRKITQVEIQFFPEDPGN